MNRIVRLLNNVAGKHSKRYDYVEVEMMSNKTATTFRATMNEEEYAVRMKLQEFIESNSIAEAQADEMFRIIEDYGQDKYSEGLMDGEMAVYWDGV